MRVLRFIMRFLGISAIILYLLSSFVFGQEPEQDITVNFPDEMTVSGSVEITNLGINGDPTYDTTPVEESDNISIGGTPTNYSYNSSASTYIDSYTDITLWNVSTTFEGAPLSISQKNIVLHFPNLNWSLLKSNFSQAVLGTKYFQTTQGGAAVTSEALPGIFGGRANLQASPKSYFTTTITDQIGNGNWTITSNWYALSGRTAHEGDGTNIFSLINVYNIFNAVFFVAAWYECFYLILAKVSKG